MVKARMSCHYFSEDRNTFAINTVSSTSRNVSTR